MTPRSSITVALLGWLGPLGSLSTPVRHALALLLVLACFGARTALGQAYPDPFMPFFPAILASAFAFGRWSGLLAVAASALLSAYFFTEPRGSFALTDSSHGLALATFVLIGVSTVLLIEALRATVEELAASNERLASAQAHLRLASERKGLLLRDINHRLKNSLQAVSGALHAAKREVRDPAAQDALLAASRRLSVLARLHERLRVDKGAAVLDAKAFVEELCADLNESLIGQRPVALHASADAVAMNFERAVALGLIVNEAVSNALKHAFPDDRPGTVVVRFAVEGDVGRLAVADDGVEAFDGARGSGASRRLIGALAAQLGGRPEWSGSLGNTLTLCFPVMGSAGSDAPAGEAGEPALQPWLPARGGPFLPMVRHAG